MKAGAMVPTLALASSLALLAAAPALAVPSFDAVRASHLPSDRPLLDRHGAVLQVVRIDTTVRRGPWVTLAEISPALREAIVLGEDRSFWAHGGVDWHALAAGAWATAWNSRTRGASTLTMQLAALIDDDLARPADGRSVGQKLMQMQRARELETGWSKAQILEAYLNRVPLRGEAVGIAAASQGLFGKQASGLDAVEAALLAAMVRGPNAAPAVIERRACEVLRLQQAGCAGLGLTLSQALARRPGPMPSPSRESLAPQLARQMPAPTAGPWQTTIDAAVQRVARAALRRQLAELRGREVDDGAAVVLDNASGEVLAWVGSSGDLSAAAAVDMVLARRQPGSTIKPFVYALALQQRLITAASVIDDAPLQLAAGAALYQPRNYDLGFKGPVSVRRALAGSLNVPAVRIGAMLGPHALFASLADAGLRPSESAGYHGHALALGSAEVTLLDLANAYRALARGGLWTPVRWHAGMPAGPQRRLFDAATAYVVADILADPAARAASFGLDSPLVTRGWAAVKTGTSKDMRDNWCIGFTSRYTVGVWVGNAGGAPMHGVSGVSGAAPVWRELVAQLHAGSPSRAPALPPGLVARRGEWFLAGTEGPLDGTEGPSGTAAAADIRGTVRGASAFGIETPRDGTVVLLDPDIPMAAQRLALTGAPGRWSIDGRPVGEGAVVHWLPRPGRHVLERRAAAGAGAEIVDRVAFEVRAAPPPGRR